MPSVQPLAPLHPKGQQRAARNKQHEHDGGQYWVNPFRAGKQHPGHIVPNKLAAPLQVFLDLCCPQARLVF